MDHSVQDRTSRELARVVASGLVSHPEWIALARGNLDQWEARNSDSPALLKCYREWRAILERPAECVAALLIDESDEATRLRQNSPFAGVVPPREVWRIKEECRNEAK